MIWSPALLARNCYSLSGSSVRLDCSSSAAYDYFEVTINQSKFGSDGLTSGEAIKFSVSNLSNPRMVNHVVSFEVTTYDDEDFIIDESIPSEPFSVMMTEVSELDDFSVGMRNRTNGAETYYTVNIVPNAPIISGDYMMVTFPPEIELPT